MVRAPDLESRGRGFKSRSDHYLEVFRVRPEFNSSATLVNSQHVIHRFSSFFILAALFQVNGQKMAGKSQVEAVNTLRSTRGLVTILVQREEVVQSPRTPAIEVSIK